MKAKTAEPKNTDVAPVPPADVDLASVAAAHAVAVAQRTEAHYAKQRAIHAFALKQNAITASALKQANAALADAEADVCLLSDVLESTEARQKEVDRLARMDATRSLREDCARKAVELAAFGKQVEAAHDVYKAAIGDLRRHADGLYEDVGRAINELSLHEEARTDLRALLLPRAAAQGPSTSAAYAGMLKGLVNATGADLSLWLELHQARTGGGLAQALLADAAMIGSRLGVELPASTKVASK